MSFPGFANKDLQTFQSRNSSHTENLIESQKYTNDTILKEIYRRYYFDFLAFSYSPSDFLKNLENKLIWIVRGCWIKVLPQVGLEPTTFGLEVQRAIHCATGACQDYQKSTLQTDQIDYK